MPFSRKRHKNLLIDPDEVFLDAGNLPDFEQEQFEGVIERPIRPRVIIALGVVFALIALIFLGRLFVLQVVDASRYRELSAANSLSHETIFAERGVIYDRYGAELVWNDPTRAYTNHEGLGHLLGYVSLPVSRELASGGIHPDEEVGRAGAEKLFNDELRGRHGLKIVEIDVDGEVRSASVLRPAESGKNIHLSLDAELTEALHGYIKNLAGERGFQGGSGIVMDVESGEVIAMTNFPEYNPNVLARADDADAIGALKLDERKPFLNRAIQGLYAPGSIFKPFVALGALAEDVISPERVVETHGYLTVPNPFNPDEPTIFRDWKDHGPVDMIDAIAHSSNVYFFKIGGGFDELAGLGIQEIAKYAELFGFNKKSGIGFENEESGLVPTPEWKEEAAGEPWRIGDTYNTAIGQYSFQVTPMQVVRATAAIANDGRLLTPRLRVDMEPRQTIIRSIPTKDFATVKRGMREAVLRGTASGLYLPQVDVAAKTGTAEVDFAKKFVNSWVIGFFPYEEPRYAFAIVMERGPRENYIGGVFVARQMLEWMSIHRPEYLEGDVENGN